MKDEADDQIDACETNANAPMTDRRVPQEAEWKQVDQAPFDDDDSPGGLTVTIIELVAEAEGISPSDVKSPPLYEVVDSAALEVAYLGSEQRVQTQESINSTEFMYRGFRIVVQSNGWVRLYEQDE